jgi:hypothetical protein
LRSGVKGRGNVLKTAACRVDVSGNDHAAIGVSD